MDLLAGFCCLQIKYEWFSDIVNCLVFGLNSWRCHWHCSLIFSRNYTQSPKVGEEYPTHLHHELSVSSKENVGKVVQFTYYFARQSFDSHVHMITQR